MIRLYLIGVVVLFIAIILNSIANYLNLSTWYILINQIEKLGFIKTIKSLNLFSIIWLFFIYPFLLGYSYILANKLYDIIY